MNAAHGGTHTARMPRMEGAVAPDDGRGIYPGLLRACLQTMDGKLCFGRPMIVRADKFVDDDLGYASKP